MGILRVLRVAAVLAVAGYSIYRLGLRGWLANQELWEWGAAAGVLLILGLLTAIIRMQKAPVWFGIVWFAGGIGSTLVCGYLSWYAWTHPASRNWYVIPLIGALAFFAVFVFWYPFLSSFRRSTRLVNRVETAIEAGDPEVERYLAEAREVVGAGNGVEQMYLDAFEGKLRHSQGKAQLAVRPLERAVRSALARGDQVLGCDAAVVLVKSLMALSREVEASEWADEVEDAWGEVAELRDGLST